MTTTKRVIMFLLFLLAGFPIYSMYYMDKNIADIIVGTGGMIGLWGLYFMFLAPKR